MQFLSLFSYDNAFMRRFVELDSAVDAAELVRRLHDASLTAITTNAPRFEGDIALAKSIVWIADDDDVIVAAQVLDEFRSDMVVSRGRNCNGCRYDLRGHAGEGRFPECGHRFQIARSHADGAESDVACDSCGEPVPAHFACCWNCGKSLSESRD